MRNYHRTYDSLSRLFHNLRGMTTSWPLWDVLRSKEHPMHDAICTLMGCYYLGVDLQEALLEFRAHRFFCDAVGVVKLPGETDMRAALEFLEQSPVHGLNFGSRTIEIFDRILADLEQQENKGEFFKKQLTIEEKNFLHENGYLIVENAIPESLCDELAEKVNRLMLLEGGQEGAGYVYGSGKMRRIYHLLAKDKIFSKIILHPVAHAVMSEMFYRPTFHTKYYLTSFHANILFPGAEEQVWHVDANVPEPLPPWIIRSNSNFIIEDYSEENGATQIIEGSHHWGRKPNAQEAQAHDLNFISLKAPKGSIVFWHGHLWHRSGNNRSMKPRVALLGCYSASFFREVCMEENPYLSLSQNMVSSMPQELKSILGWNHGAKNY